MGKRSKPRKNPNSNPRPASPKPPAPPAPKPTAGTMTLEPPPPAAVRHAPIPAGGAPLRPHAIRAIFGRNFSSYFSNPAAYVFITLFVIVCALCAFWRPVFFANNLANLAPLNEWMPYILVIFIPTITMSAWAEERRLGTDELLLTLPARDVEVVLGKYLAAVGIFTAALAFSLSLVGILFWLGPPDLGVIAASYAGYWLTGVMMIAIGLVASVLSSNVTVAFILGAAFCAIPVVSGLLAAPFGPSIQRGVDDLSIPGQFRDFGTGLIPAVGVVYFLALAATMLYLNMILVGRRHWAGGQKSRSRWAHALVRVVCLVASLAAVDVLLARYANGRLDLSQEGLHRLSPESARLVKDIPTARPVYVEAYYSEDVPRDYVQTKVDLLDKLRTFEASSGGRIKLNLIPTDLFSPQAREAEKKYGIAPRRVVNTEEARQTSSEIFLGVAFTSGLEEVVIPFIDPGLPVEYEVARSIRVVAKASRKKLGIVQTDAKILGGFEFRSMQQTPEWQVVSELKKQYDVTSVSADTPIGGDVDVLLVAQAPSLTQKQIDNVTAAVKAGKPTLLFMDPMPRFDPQLSPELPRQSPGGMFGGGQQPEPKGDLGPLLDLLGLSFVPNEIVWNPYNPITQFEVPPEIVFVAGGGAGPDAFNARDPVTSGLQRVVGLWAGYLRPRGIGPDVIPLLKVGDDGGTVAFNDLMQQGPFGMSGFNPNPRHRLSRVGYTLAARVQGKPVAGPADPAQKPVSPPPPPISAIVVADLDLIADLFFNFRRQKDETLDFDNITFVLNAVDSLAGDESYVELRKRRVRHRTLKLLEAQTKRFVDASQGETKAAEEAATEQLNERQKRLDEKVAEVKQRADLDAGNKEVMLANLQEVESRRLAVDKANIEDAKRRKIADSKAEMEQKIRGIQTGVRMLAVLGPPLPALLIGALVFAVRLGRENRGANPNRLA